MSCSICCCELSSAQVQVQPCQHTFCLDCCQHYLQTAFKEDQYRVHCPTPSCQSTLSHTQLHTLATSAELVLALEQVCCTLGESAM